MSAATWHWYSAMDTALRGQQSMTQPHLVLENMTATADAVAGTPAFAPSVKEGKEGKEEMQDSREILLGQLGIPKCISPQLATAATVVENPERRPHNCMLYFKMLLLFFHKMAFTVD